MESEYGAFVWKRKSGVEYWSADERYAIVRRKGKGKTLGWYIYERFAEKKRKLLGGPYSFALAKLAANILIILAEKKKEGAEADGEKN